MVKSGATRDHFERRIGKRKLFRIAVLKVDVGKLTTGGLGARELDERIGCVETHDLRAALGKRHREEAGPTGHIEHAVGRAGASEGDEAGQPALLRALGQPRVHFGGPVNCLRTSAR